MTRTRTKKESPFLNRLRDIIRTKQYSIRTEKSYVDWVRRFILFHNKRHPEELGEAEVGEFLTYLAVKRQASPCTQNQALNALVFLYRYMLNKPLGDILGAVRAKRPQRLPVVLARSAGRFWRVWLPFALARKYPEARKSWGWQYVFPASRRSVDPCSGVTRRHHHRGGNAVVSPLADVLGLNSPRNPSIDPEDVSRDSPRIVGERV